MPTPVLLKRARGAREAMLFDIESGRVAPSGAAPDTPARGTLAEVEGQHFALYAADGTLWFQWNERRWPLASPELRLDYAHDLSAAITTFRANDRAITYPAWWRDDPAFDPLVPEQDEQADWLAYVLAVRADPDLQASLVRAWSRTP